MKNFTKSQFPNNHNITKKLVITALFAAIASVLMFFELPIPFLPPFLKLDISGCVNIIATFTLGIVPAIFIALIKNLIHCTVSATGFVGEIADFLMTSALCLGIWIFTNRTSLKHRFFYGAVSGITVMTVVGCIANKFFLIPFFSKMWGLQAVLDMCSVINPFIGSVDGYILWGVVPFNLLKGIMVTIIGMLAYKKINKIINNSH